MVSDGSTDGTDEFLSSRRTAARRSSPCPSRTPARRRPQPRGRRGAGDLVAVPRRRRRPGPTIWSPPTCATTTRPSDDLVVIGPMITPADDFRSRRGCSGSRTCCTSSTTRWSAATAKRRRASSTRATPRSPGVTSTRRRLRRCRSGEPRTSSWPTGWPTAGCSFAFAPDAVVLHYAERSFDSWLEAAYAYGRNDVIFGRDQGQGWLLDAIGAEFHQRHALVRRLTRVSPAATAAAAARLLVRCRSPHEAPGASVCDRVASPALSAVYNLAYYRGMADELGVHRELLARFDCGRCDVTDRPRASASCSSRRSATSPTPPTCARSSSPTHRSMPCSHRVDFDVTGWARRVPGYGNWTVRAGLRSRRAIRQLGATARSTPCSSTPRCRRSSCPTMLRRTPTVVSLDATPIQYDELGAHYGHDTGQRRARAAQVAGQPRLLRAGRRPIVTWAEWTKDGLVDRYDVPADKIVVIPPGVDYERWAAIGERRVDADERGRPRPVRRRRPRAQGRPRAPRGGAPAARRRASTSSSTSSPATTAPRRSRASASTTASARTARR